MPTAYRLGGTGGHSSPLSERQKEVCDRFVLGHLWKECDALAVEGEVAGFLPALRKPVAVKIESRVFQIVGITYDPQDGAPPAWNGAGHNALIACFEDPFSPNA
ncbi:hypothetical protein GCM10007867_03350 [Gluconobacter cerinus]|uniref:Uncharacterized protein n=1 Tax=Gluconobacter cerinus TaxID=38307 RepID=A0AAV5NBP0_9PROT|nr:hypothetical protein GCM10007867_03350 [Gluconobacter cerinus]